MNKILNASIVYNLDTWPINPKNNFESKNYLFGATNIIKNSDKKYVYCGYGIIFDSGDSWSFDIDFATKIITFGANKSSSSQSENC